MIGIWVQGRRRLENQMSWIHSPKVRHRLDHRQIHHRRERNWQDR